VWGWPRAERSLFFFPSDRNCWPRGGGGEPGERFDMALAGMIGLLGAALFLYLSHAVFPVL
jgi:hypothetical protein